MIIILFTIHFAFIYNSIIVKYDIPTTPSKKAAMEINNIFLIACLIILVSKLKLWGIMIFTISIIINMIIVRLSDFNEKIKLFLKIYTKLDVLLPILWVIWGIMSYFIS